MSPSFGAHVLLPLTRHPRANPAAASNRGRPVVI